MRVKRKSAIFSLIFIFGLFSAACGKSSSSMTLPSVAEAMSQISSVQGELHVTAKPTVDYGAFVDNYLVEQEWNQTYLVRGELDTGTYTVSENKDDIEDLYIKGDDGYVGYFSGDTDHAYYVESGPVTLYRELMAEMQDGDMECTSEVEDDGLTHFKADLEKTNVLLLNNWVLSTATKHYPGLAFDEINAKGSCDIAVDPDTGYVSTVSYVIENGLSVKIPYQEDFLTIRFADFAVDFSVTGYDDASLIAVPQEEALAYEQISYDEEFAFSNVVDLSRYVAKDSAEVASISIGDAEYVLPSPFVSFIDAVFLESSEWYTKDMEPGEKVYVPVRGIGVATRLIIENQEKTVLPLVDCIVTGIELERSDDSTPPSLLFLNKVTWKSKIKDVAKATGKEGDVYTDSSYKYTAAHYNMKNYQVWCSFGKDDALYKIKIDT